MENRLMNTTCKHAISWEVATIVFSSQVMFNVKIIDVVDVVDE